MIDEARPPPGAVSAARRAPPLQAPESVRDHVNVSVIDRLASGYAAVDCYVHAVDTCLVREVSAYAVNEREHCGPLAWV